MAVDYKSYSMANNRGFRKLLNVYEPVHQTPTSSYLHVFKNQTENQNRCLRN